MRSCSMQPRTYSLASAIPQSDHLAEISTGKRERVGRACDACRIKKSKCDGSKPCSRCVSDDKVCVFRDRKRSTDKLFSGNYVDLLHSRIEVLQIGIELLVQRLNRGDTIAYLLDDKGKISINRVLDNLFLNSVENDDLAVMEQSSPSSATVSSDATSDGDDDVDENDDVEPPASETGHAPESRSGPEVKLMEYSELYNIEPDAEARVLDYIPTIQASFFDPPKSNPTALCPSHSYFAENMSVESPFLTSPSPQLLDISSLSSPPNPYHEDLHWAAHEL
ncbi:hypothetical protein V1517DRAFT_175550 [Lipomyces orientalis]|uniref:Uncharacterized protein n=1 Tax=Lipomyces orientalis TaxID=1233043 RepID=A0ACC3TMG8_9ASCO